MACLSQAVGRPAIKHKICGSNICLQKVLRPKKKVLFPVSLWTPSNLMRLQAFFSLWVKKKNSPIDPCGPWAKK